MSDDLMAFLQRAAVDGVAMQERHEADERAAMQEWCDAERARHAEAWEPTLADIRADLPEELRAFLRTPGCTPQRWDGYEHVVAPAILDVPSLAPIHVYRLYPNHQSSQPSTVLIVCSATIDRESDDQDLVWRTGWWWRTSRDSDGAIPAAEWQRAVALAMDAKAAADELVRGRAARVTPAEAAQPAPALSPAQASIAAIRRDVASADWQEAMARALAHLCEFGFGPAGAAEEGGAA